MVVRLQPIRHAGVGVPQEALYDGVTERPSIRLDLNQIVVLGTNSTTLIAAFGLAENTVSVRLEDEPTTTRATTKIRIVNVGSEGHVSVNGKLINSRRAVFLQTGDELSLHAPDRSYDYRVVVSDTDDEDENNNKEKPLESGAVSIISRNVLPFTSAAEATTTAAATPPPNWGQISEEFVCAVCLDLQVQSTTLVPCGHSFCKACLPSTTSDDTTHAFFKPTTSTKKLPPHVCSICTTTVSTTVPCRTLDNVIAALVATNQVFPTDDAQVYRERMTKINGVAAAVAAATTAPTRTPNKRKQHSPAKRRRRRRGSGGGASMTTDTSIITHHNHLASSILGGVVAPVETALTGTSASDAICID